MQHNFCSHDEFLQRTDRLAAALDCKVIDLTAKLGVSERSIFGWRSGRNPVTAKALAKLDAAERAAGIATSPAYVGRYPAPEVMESARMSVSESAGNPEESVSGGGGRVPEECPAGIARLEGMLEKQTGLLMEMIERLEKIELAMSKNSINFDKL